MRFLLGLFAMWQLAVVGPAHAGDLSLRIAPVKLTARSGERSPIPEVKASITNTTKGVITLVLPGDGSEIGLRTPTTAWSFHLEDRSEPFPPTAPPGEPRGFDDVNPLRRSEVFTLEPGGTKSFRVWLRDYRNLAAGSYKAIFYYVNDPRKKLSGSPLGPNEHGVEQMIAASHPCTLISNEIVVTIHDQRPNQAMQPTTGRRTIKFPMTQTSNPAATRALASGG